MSNKIVTASQDRNCFVWDYNESSDSWDTTMAVLRVNRAVTDVKWSPDENKFAASSGMKTVPVCHYEESNNWWVCDHIMKDKNLFPKGFKSTVLCVAWHPNNCILATGSSDFKCRVFSAFLAEPTDPDAAPIAHDEERRQEVADGFAEDGQQFGYCIFELDVSQRYVV